MSGKEESKGEEKKVAEADARAVAVNARALKFFSEGAAKGVDKMQKSLAEAESMCVRRPHFFSRPPLGVPPPRPRWLAGSPHLASHPHLALPPPSTQHLPSPSLRAGTRSCSC